MRVVNIGPHLSFSFQFESGSFLIVNLKSSGSELFLLLFYKLKSNKLKSGRGRWFCILESEKRVREPENGLEYLYVLFHDFLQLLVVTEALDDIVLTFFLGGIPH